MIRIDATTGHFTIDGVETSLAPRMSYDAFRFHPAFKVMREITSRRASNHHEHKLPDGEFEGCRVCGTVSFTNGELESLWLQVFADDSDGTLFRHEREDPRLLELQERWLREVVGVESREYPWGLVWNRYNINAGWHDIAVFFSMKS